jgi:hypothetical protein
VKLHACKIQIDLTTLGPRLLSGMLAIIIKRVKVDGLIKGVVPHLVDEGLSIFLIRR